MAVPDLISITSTIVPAITGLVALISAFVFLGRGSLKFGKIQFDFEKRTKESIAQQIDEDVAKGVSPQNALMREYHAQGLSQSRVSFWFSLVFASLGFAIIALSIGLFLQENENSGGSVLDKVASASKPIFTLVAGTVIDAVSALFFVQSNKARQLMVEFFDKLRMDRKLDEALSLIDKIQDPIIASKVKSVVAMNFSEVSLKSDIVHAMFLYPKPDAKQSSTKRDASSGDPEAAKQEPPPKTS
jgi:hypothetical protein